MGMRQRAVLYDVMRPTIERSDLGDKVCRYALAGTARCAVHEAAPDVYTRNADDGVAARLDDFVGVLFRGDVRADDWLLPADGPGIGYCVQSAVPVRPGVSRLLLIRGEAPTIG